MRTFSSNKDLRKDFTNLLESHQGIILKAANAYCRDPEDRKDLVQEITLQLWRAFPGYDDRYRPSTWIYRIAFNVAITWYRKFNRERGKAIPLADGFPDVPEVGVPDSRQGEVDQLHRFINELKELDKALMLLYLEEKSYQEIAEILGISVTNVATKISRIKKKLQQKFSIIKNDR